MNHSLSLFVFDFAAGFDDFGVNAFYDFSADFKCLFDFDFGSSFDCFSNFEGSLVSSEIPDDESVGAWSGDSGPPRQRRRSGHITVTTGTYGPTVGPISSATMGTFNGLLQSVHSRELIPHHRRVFSRPTWRELEKMSSVCLGS